MDTRSRECLCSRIDKQHQTAFQSRLVASNITAEGSSSIHIGNNVYFVTSQCSPACAGTIVSKARTQEDDAISNAEKRPSKRRRSTHNAAKDSRKSRKQDSLAVAFGTLGGFSKWGPEGKEGEEMERLAAHLDTILDCCMPVEADEIHDEMNRSLHSLKNQLKAMSRININKASPQRQVDNSFEAESNICSVVCERWQITFATKVVKSICADGGLDIQTCSTIHVQPLLGYKGPRLGVIFSEWTNTNQHTTLHPVILAYNQVPYTSRIFAHIADDDLNGFVRQLADGASFRDCDEEGRSLLFVSDGPSMVTRKSC